MSPWLRCGQALREARLRVPVPRLRRVPRVPRRGCGGRASCAPPRQPPSSVSAAGRVAQATNWGLLVEATTTWRAGGTPRLSAGGKPAARAAARDPRPAPTGPGSPPAPPAPSSRPDSPAGAVDAAPGTGAEAVLLPQECEKPRLAAAQQTGAELELGKPAEAAGRAELALPRGPPLSAKGRSRRTLAAVHQALYHQAGPRPAAQAVLCRAEQGAVLQRPSSVRARASHPPAFDARASALALASALVVTVPHARLLAPVWDRWDSYAPDRARQMVSPLRMYRLEALTARRRPYIWLRVYKQNGVLSTQPKAYEDC